MFDVWDGFNSFGGHWENGEKDTVYKPDTQTDNLITFMKTHAGGEKPLIAVNGYYPPHDPYTVPERFYEPYRGKGAPFAGYYEAVSAVDEAVGRLVDAVDELGIAENTIIIKR